MSEEKNVQNENKTSEGVCRKNLISKICSAVIGLVVGIAGTFGVTYNQIAENKATTNSIRTLATDALEAMKKGDVATATAKLQEAVAVGKEAVASAKQVSEKVEEINKNSIVETAQTAATTELVKEEVKKVDNATEKVNQSKQIKNASKKVDKEKEIKNATEKVNQSKQIKNTSKKVDKEKEIGNITQKIDDQKDVNKTTVTK